MNYVPDITIVVPIYQAFSTLRACVDSVLAQTYKQWELLLIDDGSDDGSLDLCYSLSEQDKRIQVYTQRHQGVSAARNLGLRKLKGEYVCFVDADDTIDPDFLTELYQFRDYDMVICGYYVDWMSSNGELLKRNQHIPDNIEITTLNDRKKLLPLFLSGMVNINCNKLLHSSIIKKYNICYPSVPINEDYLFMVDYLSFCTSLITICKPLYHWKREEGKITGVDICPDNLLNIYNFAHQKTRFFFSNFQQADIVMYYSYCFIILKYYSAFKKGVLTSDELSLKLSTFHKNELVKASFDSYKPKSRGERFMCMILKHGWFHIYQWIQIFTKVWKN